MPSIRPTHPTLPMWIILGTLIVVSGILLVTGLATWDLESPRMLMCSTTDGGCR